VNAATLSNGAHPSTRWPAFGYALALETVVITGLVAWAAAHPTVPAPVVLPIEIEAAPAPVETAPPPIARPEPPKPEPMKDRLPPRPIARTPPSPAPAPVRAQPAESPPTSTPVVEAAQPAVAATVATPPPPVVAPPAGPSADYVAKVRAAVQAAFVYPAAAKALEFRGRTRVAFSLLDTTPRSSRVLVSSGMALVDNAALRAVQNAVYPSPAPELRGNETSFEVWVEFRP